MQQDFHSIAFLPWANLEQDVTVGAVTFAPVVAGGKTKPIIPAPLSTVATELATIISSYRDFRGRQVRRFTISTVAGTPLEADKYRQQINEARLFLILCAIGANEYLGNTNRYTNSSAFEIVFQRFRPGAEYTAITARRRDGSMTGMGYKHGEITFAAPFHVAFGSTAHIDDSFANALHALTQQRASHGELYRRILGAASFFSLANTDDPAMISEAEIILMGSAFEQLFGEDKVLALGRKFGAVMDAYGRVRVEDAHRQRAGIQLDAKHAAAEKKWFVHRTWLKELHNLRSTLVHGGDLSSRTWGWDVWEHLLMASFVFPLATKLLLVEARLYEPTRDDRGALFAIDRLLAAARWGHVVNDDDEDDDGPTPWDRILFDSRLQLSFR